LSNNSFDQNEIGINNFLLFQMTML